MLGGTIDPGHDERERENLWLT